MHTITLSIELTRCSANVQSGLAMASLQHSSNQATPLHPYQAHTKYSHSKVAVAIEEAEASSAEKGATMLTAAMLLSGELQVPQRQ